MNKKKRLISVFALAALVFLDLLLALGGCGNVMGSLGEIDASTPLTPLTVSEVPVSTISADAKTLTFALDKEYTGDWKVYTVPEDGSASTVVSALFDAETLTLTLMSSKPIAPRKYYVSLTAPGKAESTDRLVLWGEPLAGTNPMSLAERFRLAERWDGDTGAVPGGADGVSAMFTLLHTYIAGVKDSVTAANDYTVPGIALGDWVDLPSLTVAADGGGGGFSETNAEVPGHGRLLRLLVVGNNSFNSDRAKAIDEEYNISYDAYNPPDDKKERNNGTPHLVFQFQNLFGTRRMDGTSTHRCYYDCDIRTYLNDKYLTGLAAAGLPADYLFAPIQYSLKNDGNSSEWITDKVWLPTMRQLFWNDTWALTRPSPSAIHHREFPEYQPRLEYYTDNESRIKGKLATDTDGYFTWTASTPDNNGKGLWVFNASTGSITATSADIHDADDGTPRVCPAFCVW
jgi:hypothetical protein